MGILCCSLLGVLPVRGRMSSGHSSYPCLAETNGALAPEWSRSERTPQLHQQHKIPIERWVFYVVMTSRSAAREGENSQWLFEGALLGLRNSFSYLRSMSVFVPRSSTNMNSKNTRRGVFYRVYFLLVSHKIKQPPASSGCFVWSFVCCLFLATA
jgi:hypothetical protein